MGFWALGLGCSGSHFNFQVCEEGPDFKFYVSEEGRILSGLEYKAQGSGQ